MIRICIEKILPIHHEEVNSIYNSEKHTERLLAAFYTKKLWRRKSSIKISFLNDGEHIPRTYEFHGKVDPLQSVVNDMPVIDAIKKIVKERIEPLVDLEFIWTDVNPNVKIDFDTSSGSWSLIGTDCLHETGATMNFGWFDVATVIHEFGHLLGMIHEHQNPKGKTIQWDKEKVYNWAAETQGWDKKTTDVNIIDKYDLNLINGSSFDPKSIMLYFFPGYLTLDGKGTQQNLVLSDKDIFWMHNTYPGKVIPNKKNNIHFLILPLILLLIVIIFS